MLYLLHTVFKPNTAPTNRVLSFIRGFSECGIQCCMVYLVPDENCSIVDHLYPNVCFWYMWENQGSYNRYLKQVQFQVNLRHFLRTLKPGDDVLLLDMSRAIFPLVKQKNVHVYHERTEHPYAYKVRTINVKHYIRACAKLSGLFVISNPLRQFYIDNGVNPEIVHIINMTVDSTRFLHLKKEHTEQYVAYCGTVTKGKDGVDELIKAFSIVKEGRPDVKLYIIGKVPSKEEELELKSLIRNCKLEDSVVMTGIVPYSDMPQILKNAAVLALDRSKSLQAEYGFPTKLGEYLLTENPVVITKVGDIPLFLKDGVSALLCEERNPEEFASKIEWALDNPEEASIVGHNGAIVAGTEFNYLKESRKILDVILAHRV